MKSSSRLPDSLAASLGLLTLVFCAGLPLAAQTPESGVTSVSPGRIVTGMAQVLEIKGDGLSGAQVFLRPLSAGGTPDFQVRQVELVSPQLLRVRLPGDVKAGEYRICVEWPRLRECRSFEVLAFQASIKVEPKRVFNSRASRVEISGSSPGTWQRAVLEGMNARHELAVQETTDAQKKPVLAVTIQSGLSAGKYRLLLFRDDKDPGLLAAEIVVSGPLKASVEKVEPSRIRRFRDENVIVRIDGLGLGEVVSATLWGQSDCQKPDGYFCKLLPQSSDRQLVFEIEPEVEGSLFGNESFLRLADGTRMPLKEVSFLEPIVPWSVGSWVVFIVLLLLGLALPLFEIDELDLYVHKSNQTAPGRRALAGWIARMLLFLSGIALLISVLVAGFTAGGIFGINLSYLATIVLMNANLRIPFGFAAVRSQLEPERPGAGRGYLLATAAALIALGGPFLLDRLDLLQWGLPGEAALLGLTLLGGGAATTQTSRRLERKRALAANETALTAAIEVGLSQKGRVSLKELPAAPRDRALQIMAKYWAEHRASRSLRFSEGEGLLAYERWQGIQAVASGFRAARPAPPTGEEWQRAANDLMQQLAQWLPFTAVPHPAFPPDGPFAVFQATPLQLESVLPSPFPLLAFSEPGIEEQQIQALREILNALDAPSRFAVLVPRHPGRAVREQVAKRLVGPGRENLVVLEEGDWLEILMGHEEVRGELMKAIQRQADISVFTPYRSEGPTTAEMFFGREREIQTVLKAINQNSVSILGARRIGKTSMVRTVQRLLEEQGKLLFYLDCYHIRTYKELFQEINTRWDIPDVSLRGPLDFPRLVVEIQGRHPGRSIVFLLDEIDRLLAWDAAAGRDEKLFRTLRSLSQVGLCQFVFSGERTILDRREDSSSAFFNFGAPVQLGLLDRDTSALLVHEPMSLVGVSLTNEEELLSLIYDWTSGHPNLIQFLCEQSLQELSRAKSRALEAAQVRRMAEDTTYRDRYVQTFWSQSSPLEKAISICLAEEGGGTGSEIWERLRRAGFECSLNEIERGFRYLRLSQLLTSEEDRYVLKPSRFALLAGSMYSYASWKASLLHEWTRGERTDD